MSRRGGPSCERAGFSLVELLVVVAIITLLLSIMLPAVERALYEAELAVCATQLREVGQAFATYASANNRMYPDRKLWDYRANLLKANYDERPLYRALFPINAMLNDPLLPKVDLETEKSGLVFSAPYLYYGFGYSADTRVLRMGDRLEWQDVEVNTLAADQDAILLSNDWATSSHPDRDGRMNAEAYQDREEGAGGLLPLGLGGTTGLSGFATFAYWIDHGTWQRGPIDKNYLRADLGVERFNGVVWNDDRMWSMPEFSGADYPTSPNSYNGAYTLLPR